MIFESLFPPAIDNNYRGHRLALWLLGTLVLVKGAMGLNCIFNGYTVATTADGIALDTFSPAGASAVVSFLGLWGWSLLLFSLLGVLALIRYRALVPLVFLLLLTEQLGRKAILLTMPVATVGSPPAFSINSAIIAMMLIGLVLAMWPRRNTRLKDGPS